MPTMALDPNWKAAACIACKNLKPGDHCEAWGRRVDGALSQPVRMCKHYDPKRPR